MPDTPDYGESFADVYDRWYGDVTDVAATADTVEALARAATGPAAGRVLELGVGSGRLAVPIAGRGLAVTGVDSSPSMLALLAGRPEADAVTVVEGDMTEVDALVTGPFAVALVAFNTFFNLTTEDAQRRCLAAVARVLAPGGSLLVEAFVPGDPPSGVARDLSTSRVELDRVVLTATEHDPATQVVTGQHIELVDGGATVRLRPWRIRYATTDQLDAMAAAAGLDLADRRADWAGNPFTDDSTQHVSRYVRR
ncbi:MAG TPA: class I SAM-dependent methyltransferase [Acidimicrobiales bacterium]|nr:class I SAM-dependent methyltransferase [Acidimicrobiales bacterium]